MKALSPRETQVMHGRFLGDSYKEIASNLHISEHTVKNHAKRSFDKLGVRNSLGAVRLLQFAS